MTQHKNLHLIRVRQAHPVPIANRPAALHKSSGSVLLSDSGWLLLLLSMQQAAGKTKTSCCSNNHTRNNPRHPRSTFPQRTRRLPFNPPFL